MVRHAVLICAVILLAGGALAKAPAKPSEDEMMKDATDIAASIQLPCAVSEANVLAKGKANIAGQMLDTTNVEIACGNGMGYLLTSSPPQRASGYSCIAADHERAKDPTGVACTLPVNADVKKTAANMLAGLGAACTVAKVNWIGVSGSSEIIEVACSGGNGYVLTGPMPGESTKPLSAMTCADASARDVFTCKMSNSGPPPITMDTFKNALVQHNVACNATNMRPIGKETTQKRHIVEFQCPQQHPEGLVALIPLQDSTAPFETLSCAQAAETYRIICTYVRP